MVDNGTGQLFPDGSAAAFDVGARFDTRAITDTERAAVLAAGIEFSQNVGGVWLFINGRFTSENGQSTEIRVRDLLYAAFGYPSPDGPTSTVNVLLNSPGGSLDSAYQTVLYLSDYAKELNVYVPDRAKSASTLLAVGADTVYLSPFAELGPLDTQIPDPRNPANTVSALDCYQSVDYVRDFGFKTITAALPQFVNSTERRLSVTGLLDIATKFALGTITPILSAVTALDFGGWGRSLRIGEHYARKLLESKSEDGDRTRAERVAHELVYGYTHHLFPIDYHEAQRLGLSVAKMDQGTYDEAMKVVSACHKKDFVTFLSKKQVDATRDLESRPPEDDQRYPLPRQPVEEHPQAEASVPRAWPSRDRRDAGGQ